MVTGSDIRQSIKLESLSKSYGSVRAVRSIDVEITFGETVAILGPNGAGKTTTIDMMLGLTRPDSGRISLFGMEPGEAVRAGAIGGMLQTGTPIPYLSTRELITMVASLYPNPISVDEALRLSGTGDIADRQTTKLSGGQTQRVRFAIALVANAKLLVLDEPTAAVDVERRRDFWAVMRSIAVTGKTVVFATHCLEEADAYADRIIVMARSQVVADGSATEIKAIVSNALFGRLPEVSTEELKSLVGVVSAERHGDAVLLSCNDSDAALRELLSRNPDPHDIEVHGAGIEEAFLGLTTEDGDDEEPR
jgi:ABC-2 type transport system ATP-binding protein